MQMINFMHSQEEKFLLQLLEENHAKEQSLTMNILRELNYAMYLKTEIATLLRVQAYIWKWTRIQKFWFQSRVYGINR